MKIYAINGGPRKGWNTDTMLKKFLEGAASAGIQVETEMVYLYDLNYKGCISCYACQSDNNKTYGQCQVRDDIYTLLREVPRSDGVVFGCPVYMRDLTAELRAFIERLVYQYLSFDKNRQGNNAPQKLRTAMIYTMNVTEEIMQKSNYDFILGTAEQYLQNVFGVKPVRICAYNTYQYKDYSRYRASFWDEPQKAEYHRTQFPLDCQAAYDAGKKMIADILNER
ncbi:flavodoxin family protein [Lacrimispora sp.]|jgi:multimeric flavodoxin WrbA|uniref:flavodoxin family protein n=1 Tax=Lacrimispora sp. TaxID=2719234 RepID=UPI00289D2638|nr:flavodoxin family protein [Lacrimispora sp.]